MKICRLLFLLLVVIILTPACAADRPKFCVSPGDRIEAMRKSCSDIKPITEYTEEGEVTSYVVSSSGYIATVEPEGDVIEVVRFRQNPLPFPGVHIGEGFDRVRMKHKAMKLVFGVGESEYLALADEASGVYIAFDVTGLPSDWRSSAANEAKLSKAKVIALNFVMPR